MNVERHVLSFIKTYPGMCAYEIADFLRMDGLNAEPAAIKKAVWNLRWRKQLVSVKQPEGMTYFLPEQVTWN